MSISDTYEKLDHGSYVNNQVIPLGGVPFTARDVLIKAPITAGLNVYLLGGSGEGKSQLCYDMLAYFGGSGAEGSACYAEGRPDFEPSEILRQIRLDRLDEVTSDAELIELTANVRKKLFYVEEINRCPPIVQNYFFNFMDGKFAHLGNIQQLGSDGYTLGYATGNIGDNFIGISDSDRALLDRMHMIVKLDHPDFDMTTLDEYRLYGGLKDPRAVIPEGTDLSQEIVQLHQAFGERKIGLLLPALGIFFRKGLDYLEATPRHSKRALNSHWATAEGVRQDNDESKIHPLSKRAIFGAIGLTCALETIAEAKGHTPDTTNLFLDALRLTVPYSGVIEPRFVDVSHGGDIYAAFDALLGEESSTRAEIEDRRPYLEEACLLAEAGEKDVSLLNKIAPYEGRWSSVRNAISAYADRRAEDTSEKGLQVKTYLKGAKEV